MQASWYEFIFSLSLANLRTYPLTVGAARYVGAVSVDWGKCSATGGNGSVHWRYAPETYGIESPGFGLTGFRVETTPRSLSAARCAEELNLDLLDRARKVSATHAVYVYRKSDLLCFASERREEIFAGSLRGIFKAAYKRCIPIRFFLRTSWISCFPATSGLCISRCPWLSAIRKLRHFKRS